MTFNRKCELTSNICHNVTIISKPVSTNTQIFQGSIKIFNTTPVTTCQVLKTNRNKDHIKGLMIIRGLRPCDEFKKGLHCLNGTAMKLENLEKSIQLLTMTSGHNEFFRIIDTIYFQKGRSCVNATFALKKY